MAKDTKPEAKDEVKAAELTEDERIVLSTLAKVISGQAVTPGFIPPAPASAAIAAAEQYRQLKEDLKTVFAS